MAKDQTQRDPARADRDDAVVLSPDEDAAVCSVSADFTKRLNHYVDRKREGALDDSLPGDYLGQGVVSAALEMVGPDGEYRLDERTFWQILQQNYPFGRLPRMLAELQESIEDLFHEAKDEDFEDGYDSVLSLRLKQHVLTYGEAAVDAAAELILKQCVTSEVAAEALRCLAEVEHAATYEARRTLLEKSLACSSHVTRDGAVIGLEDFGDPRSIPALEAAVAEEDYRMLKDDMRRLLEQLRKKVVQP